MNNNTTSLHHKDLELHLFRSLESELNLSTTKKITRIVRIVLTSVMERMPETNVNETIQKLPSTLQLIFKGNWKSHDHHDPVLHLDELVENVCKEGDANSTKLFSNEVEALESVLIVIKNLKIIFDKIGVIVFPYSLINEYQQALQENTV